MRFEQVIIAFAAVELFGCTRLQSSDPQAAARSEAVCRSLSFLRVNGFLDELGRPQDPQFRYFAWDEVSYGNADGKIDDEKLLKGRRGTYSNRLWGTQFVDGDVLVLFKAKDADRFSCVRVTASNVVLHEANCLRDKSFVRASAISSC